VNQEGVFLQRVEKLLRPRHLFLLPDWANAELLERLLALGYLTCTHFERDAQEHIRLIMGLELTPAGQHYLCRIRSITVALSCLLVIAVLAAVYLLFVR
jgi:hypothetical protein